MQTWSFLYWKGYALLHPTSLWAQREFEFKIHLVSFDVVMTLNKTTAMANMPAPIQLDDADGVEQTAVAQAEAPHADPGLQPDRRPLLPHIGIEVCPLPLLQQRDQLLLPPALDDPRSERRVQQRPTHQGAPPPGLDL